MARPLQLLLLAELLAQTVPFSNWFQYTMSYILWDFSHSTTLQVLATTEMMGDFKVLLTTQIQTQTMHGDCDEQASSTHSITH